MTIENFVQNLIQFDFYWFFRCPVGSIITNDGKSCKSVDDCDKDNCMKEERQCMSSAAHLCSCSDNSTVCNRNENYFTINTSTIAVSALIVCVINIPRKIYSLTKSFI